MQQIQDVQGRAMEVSDFIIKMAKAYGWEPGIADEGLAKVMEEIRADGGGNSIGSGQSISGSQESASIIGFCRGGPVYNAANEPAYAVGECPDYHELYLAFSKLHARHAELLADIQDVHEQIEVLIGKVLTSANVEAMGKSA